MPIQEYRYILVENKIITRADAQRLANEMYSIYKKRGKAKAKEIEFTIYCDENVVFRSAEPDIFSDNSPVNSKRAIVIEMQVTFDAGDVIKINLKHGPYVGMENSIVVMGNDSNWVNGTLKRIEEIFDSFTPQNAFVYRFENLLVPIFAATIGLAFMNMAFVFFSWIFPEPSAITLSESTTDWLIANRGFVLTIVYVMRYLFAFWVGISPAVRIVSWLKSFFPKVELQISPEHKMIEKRRRSFIAGLVSTSGIVSLILQIGYDLLAGL